MSKPKTKAASDILRNWTELNAALMSMNEAEVSALIAAEKKDRNRVTVLLRLQSRFNKLRRERERRELIEG